MDLGAEPAEHAALSASQIETFLRDGVVVVDDILSPHEVDSALQGLKASLARHGVDTDDLLGTGDKLRSLSSTNGSGGVLDLVYDKWKLDIALNAKLFEVTTELWRAGFCHKSETREHVADEEGYKWHPFGSFDCSRGYAYIDRIGFRIPTDVAEQLGRTLQTDSPQHTVKVKSKSHPIQRCLTPHLDCCPETFLSPDKTKWRPIQCMVSLTDNLEANTGGFEAAKGFHQDFEEWSKNRSPSRIARKARDGKKEMISVPAPCVGEYTHIRPTEDADVMKRIEHIPVQAGSAVFWDNRLPHANAYRHDGAVPRCVVYCSFLPDVPVNRNFAAQQLKQWKQGLSPIDTKWMSALEECSLQSSEEEEELEEWLQRLPLTQRRLLGVEEWSP